MRRHFSFPCGEHQLIGSIDGDNCKTGLLIVSGGNELRSGAHGGMARLAQEIAVNGVCVMRYDRRGIGDSEGDNCGYLTSADDIRAAAAAFREHCPNLSRIVAFGNCDAASALAMFAKGVNVDALVLANPWVIDDAGIKSRSGDAPALPPPSAVRDRYRAKLKDPRSLLRLFSGQVDLRKLFRGLRQASKTSTVSETARQTGNAMARLQIPTQILLASRDRTAMAFADVWTSTDFVAVRNNANIVLDQIDSSSHSFANETDHRWLVNHLLARLQNK